MYNKGDRIRLKDTLTEGQYGSVWFSEDLKEFSPTTIEKALDDGTYLTEDGYVVTDEMIEPAEELGRIYRQKKPILEPTIKDSGERREFSSGAVRDVQTGKGRCDLLPLWETGLWADRPELMLISKFIETREEEWLRKALDRFIIRPESGYCGMQKEEVLLDVSKHYEEGAKKYEERNWEKGIPLHAYIDSGVRHFLKCMAGWDDEPHNRAFIWNMLGAIWTLENKPEFDDLPGTDANVGSKGE